MDKFTKVVFAIATVLLLHGFATQAEGQENGLDFKNDELEQKLRLNRILDETRNVGDTLDQQAVKFDNIIKDEQLRILQLALETRVEDKQRAIEELGEVKYEINELRLQQQAREHAVGYDYQRNPIFNEGQIADFGFRVNKIEQVREKQVQRLLRMPGSRRGAIWSGNGLNDLLDRLSPIAFEHQFSIKQLKSERIKNAEIIEELQNSKPDSREITSRENDQRLYNMKIDLLESIQGIDLTPKQITRIQFKRIGGRAGMVLNSDLGPIPVDWHILTSIPELNLGKYKQPFEDAKRAAIEQLRKNKPMLPETIHQFLKISNAMEQEAELFEQRICRGGGLEHHEQAKVWKSMYFRQIRNRVQRLKHDLAVLVSARSLSEITIEEEFQGSTFGELLAYMRENGYHFDNRTDDNQRNIREILFQGMLSYFFQLEYLTYTLQDDEATLRHLEQRELNLQDLAYENLFASMNDTIDMLEQHKTDRARERTNQEVEKTRQEFWKAVGEGIGPSLEIWKTNNEIELAREKNKRAP